MASRRGIGWSALRIGVPVVAVYASLCGFLWVKQRDLIFLPDRQHIAAPKAPFQDVSFATSDGVKLHGWFVEAEGEPSATVLFCHGNGGNLSHASSAFDRWTAAGFDVFAFDYRGYGRSEGEHADLTEARTYTDVEAAWRFLTETRALPADRIIVWGHSLGGGICSWIAAEKNPRALILESTFTRLPDVAAEIYWWVPVRWLSSYRYPTQDRLAELQIPVVIAHARGDTVIPFHHGQSNFAAAREPKRFFELHGDHMAPFSRDQLAEIRAFIEAGE